MAENMGTQVGRMTIRKPRAAGEPEITWKKAAKRRPGERLLGNMAVASALLICAVALRSGALPELSPAADAVLTAATDDSLLDDQLGRLSFVCALFPEAALVFGAQDDALALPVSGGAVVHAWSAQEPWMSWRTGSGTVTSASDGEVVGVYHGNGDERLVQVLGADGLACLYGNLAQVSVSTGDAVSVGDAIGTLMTGADAVFEVRRDGVSIDPALLLGGA
ncbi:MAG: M23 family metallopeptidase [Clostridia bacterium]|nr:M23 family metallopeptidase [Clostridia bacterium]